MAADYCRRPLAIPRIHLTYHHPSMLEGMLDIVGVTPFGPSACPETASIGFGWS